MTHLVNLCERNIHAKNSLLFEFLQSITLLIKNIQQIEILIKKRKKNLETECIVKMGKYKKERAVL